MAYEEYFNDLNRNLGGTGTRQATMKNGFYNDTRDITVQQPSTNYGTGYSAAADGGSMGYQTGTTGTPATTTTAAESAAATGSTGTNGNGKKSYKDWVNQIYDAALENQKAQLEQQYAGLEQDYQLAKDNLHKTYLDDLNRTAVEAQKANMNWNEAKNALGLSSGTMGQAYLARQNATQDSMSDLRAAELAAQAKIEADYQKQKSQYAAALREAIAKNDYERAKQLYELALNGQLGGTSGGGGTGGGSTGMYHTAAYIGGPRDDESAASTGSSKSGKSGKSSTGGKENTANAGNEYYQGLLNTANAAYQTVSDRIAAGNQTKDSYVAEIQSLYNNGRLTTAQYYDLLDKAGFTG